MEKIGKRLKRIRKEYGVRVSEVADCMGTSMKVVYNIEAGITQPTIENLMAMCDLYDVTMDFLVGYEKRDV